MVSKYGRNPSDIRCVIKQDATGAKTVTVKTCGHEKTHYTVVLACCADGTKLPPLLILKRKTLPKERIPNGVYVHVHPKGWMDEGGVKVWINKVWSRRPEADEPKNDTTEADEPKNDTTEADEPKNDTTEADEPKNDTTEADEPKNDTTGMMNG
ncbi:Pogo transposable element-like 84 [Homarus americanus]|uniref:Pogo transposable element-like 84 n=1 Tax=Homarus americanus TaxID=6706 RepID=A0A8J5JZG1_HOMAM|nr:Pogo transposable element-like 84 [Homarus americanus]